MKKLDLFDFDSFTDKGLLSLTEEDIEKVIKIKELEAGLVKAVKPAYVPRPKVLDDINHSTVYTHYFMSYAYFTDRKDAEKLIELLNKANLVEVVNRHNMSVVKPLEEYYVEKKAVIVEKRIVTKEEYLKIKDISTIYNKEAEEYKRLNTLYLNYMDRRNDLELAVRNRIREALERKERLSYILKLFKEEYFDVCEGDFNMAWNFFEKANYEYSSDEKALIHKKFNLPTAG